MKCLLVSHLALFRLSALMWSVSCNHSNFACFLWPTELKHSSSNHYFCCFHSYWPRMSLAENLFFSLVLHQAIFISLVFYTFSLAANLFTIRMSYCFLASRDRVSPYERLLCPFIYLWSVPNFCSHQILISTNWAPLNNWISRILECYLLSVKMWSTCLWVFQSVEIQVHWWMFQCMCVMFLKIRPFDLAKFTTVNAIILLFACELQLLVLRYLSSPLVHWNLRTVSIQYLRNLLNILCNSS